MAIAVATILVSMALLPVVWPATRGTDTAAMSPSLPATLSAGSQLSAPPTSTGAPTVVPSAPASPSIDPGPVTDLIGAGDVCVTANIADARKTAALVSARPTAVVFTLGDNSNETGTAAQYVKCYGSTWGAFLSRTHPAAGNHDVLTSHGRPYYAYFGSAAGASGLGYYGYDLPADWHVIVLNSNCDEVGGCGAGSPEEVWLKANLAANSGKHIIAMWHHPEFSSGGHFGSTSYRTWWDDLYAAHADIVLNGHDHDYERFAQQSSAGEADPKGIREFVVGTGGASHTPLFLIRPNSEVSDGDTLGVLKLTLKSNSYSWQFIPVDGATFTDSGQTATNSAD